MCFVIALRSPDLSPWQELESSLAPTPHSSCTMMASQSRLVSLFDLRAALNKTVNESDDILIVRLSNSLIRITVSY